jgi:AraC-like DNA-binding protein
MWTSITRRGHVTLERRMLPEHEGLLALDQTFMGSDTRAVVTHGASILACVEVIEGRLSFPLTSGSIEAPSRFVLVIPPRSVLPMQFEKALVRSQGIAGFSLPVMKGASLLEWHGEDLLVDRSSAERAACGRLLQELRPDEGVAASTVRARMLLHKLIAHPAPLRSAAKQVGLSTEALSRSFSRAYTVPPKQYCHRARLFEAALRLMLGATVLEAAFDAGFQDLKRFYVQFKRLLGTTPGTYVQVKKRQDNERKNRL